MPTLPLITVWLPVRALPPARNATLAESRASGTEPLVSCEAFSAVKPLPLPVNELSGCVNECGATNVAARFASVTCPMRLEALTA